MKKRTTIRDLSSLAAAHGPCLVPDDELHIALGGRCVKDGTRPTYDMENQVCYADTVWVCDPID